jgi:mRNA interferase RelE/StbE
MSYKIELKPSAVRSLAKIPKDDQRAIRLHIDSLANNPFPPNVRKLEGEETLYRVRVGDYRIIYQVHKKILLIVVLVIGHLKEVCRGLKS